MERKRGKKRSTLRLINKRMRQNCYLSKEEIKELIVEAYFEIESQKQLQNVAETDRSTDKNDNITKKKRTN